MVSLQCNHLVSHHLNRPHCPLFDLLVNRLASPHQIHLRNHHYNQLRYQVLNPQCSQHLNQRVIPRLSRLDYQLANQVLFRLVNQPRVLAYNQPLSQLPPRVGSRAHVPQNSQQVVRQVNQPEFLPHNQQYFPLLSLLQFQLRNHRCSQLRSLYLCQQVCPLTSQQIGHHLVQPLRLRVAQQILQLISQLCSLLPNRLHLLLSNQHRTRRVNHLHNPPCNPLRRQQ